MAFQASSSQRGDSPRFNLRGEADYRIAKSLTMISGMIRLRAFKADLSDPQAALLEIADRIDAVGALHSLLVESLTGTVQLSSDLQQVCRNSAQALAPQPTEFIVDCRPEHLVPFRVALPLGLLTAELISNSMKHGSEASAPGRVTIFCSRPRNDLLRFSYHDDGPGFPDDFDMMRDGKAGMRLIQSLCERMHGDGIWANTADGLRFDMTVPMS